MDVKKNIPNQALITDLKENLRENAPKKII
jgi:hypothetical protein